MNNYLKALTVSGIILLLLLSVAVGYVIRIENQTLSVVEQTKTTIVATNKLEGDLSGIVVTAKDKLFGTPNRPGSIQLLNASLIHSDLVLGNLARSSELSGQASQAALTAVDNLGNLIAKTTTDEDIVVKSVVGAIDSVATMSTHANTVMDGLNAPVASANLTLQSGTRLLDSANKLLSDQNIPQTLADFQSAMKEVVAILGSSEVTAADIERVANTLEQKIDNPQKSKRGYIEALLYMLRIAGALKVLVF